jgi:hypothetical protein
VEVTRRPPRDDAIAFDLRYASRFLTEAAKGAANEAVLNNPAR